MGKLNEQREITLTVEQCQKLGVQPGDEIESLIIDGLLVLRKKEQEIGNLQDVLNNFSTEIGNEDLAWLNERLYIKLCFCLS